MAITIAFDKSAQGWVSQYSFIPDAGVSLNNNFYTFKDGLIYRHGVETAPFNTFYGGFSPTEIKFIFNEAPSNLKTFKTINYEGAGSWDVDLETDQNDHGNIEADWFKIKEGKYFAWIRGLDNELYTLPPDYDTSATGGLGVIEGISDEVHTAITNVLTEGTLTFNTVPSNLSIGDALYSSSINGNDLTTPVLFGLVKSISSTTVVFTTGDVESGLALPATLSPFHVPTSGEFVTYTKNRQVEKSGLLGFYTIVTLTHNPPDTTEHGELFAVSSEIQAHR